MSHIQHREPANYLLVGERQLGKSSLLLALQRRYTAVPAVDCRYASLGLDPIPQLALAFGLPVAADRQQVLRAIGDVPPGARPLRLLDEAGLDRAMDSQALRSALDAWSELTTDQAAARLGRIICYALVERAAFSLAGVLDRLDALGQRPAPEVLKASLTRLEIAFIIGRSGGQYFWQVPLWREQVLREEPGRLLAAELG